MRRLTMVLALVLWAGVVSAQTLTTPQLQTMKANLAASADLVEAGTPDCGAFVGVAVNAVPNTGDGNFCLARVYARTAAPDFFVWRTNVSRADIYNGNPQPENSFWNWTTYKNQGVAEQNAWVQMFMGDQADFSKANVRAGVAAIFTGSAQANAQRDHVLATGRRLANRFERVFATGVGSIAAPGTLVFEGTVSPGVIETARNLP